jgi:hypothetical protein
MQLGGSGNMFDDFPQKPKGMHRRTYTVNDMCRPPRIKIGKGNNQSATPTASELVFLASSGDSGLSFRASSGSSSLPMKS